MAVKQFFGVKYPFTNQGSEHFYVDANQSTKEKARSMLMHVVFTPKGQRIRNPEFGTDLIKFIFEPNEDVTWEAVKNEVSDSVKKWIPNTVLNDIQVVTSDADESEIYVKLNYSVQNGNRTMSDSVVVTL